MKFVYTLPITLCLIFAGCSKSEGGDGASASTTSASGAPAAATANFASVKGVFDANCVKCHSAERASGGADLHDFAGASKVSGKLVALISGPTPAMPKKAAPLSAADVELVKKWVDAGAKE